MTTADVTGPKMARRAAIRKARVADIAPPRSSGFVGPLRFDESVNTALADIGALANAARVWVFLISDDGEYLDNTYEWCREGVTPRKGNCKHIPCERFSRSLDRLRRGEVVNIANVSATPSDAARELSVPGAGEVRAILMIPVHADGKFMGLIGIDDPASADACGENDLARIRTSAGIIGEAIAQKPIEEAGSDSGAFLDSLFDSITDFISVCDKDYRIVKMNSALEKIVGRASLGKPCYQVYHGHAVPCAGCQMVKVMATGQPEHYSGHTGAWGKRFEITSFPLKDREGLINGAVVCARNVDHRNNKTKLPVDSEELYRLLGENITDVLFTLDTDFRLTYVSPSVEPIVGYTSAELTDDNSIFERILCPASMKVFLTTLSQQKNSYHKGRRQNSSRVVELEFMAKGGAREWAEVKVSCLRNQDGSLAGFMGVGRAITERKRAEQALRASHHFLEIANRHTEMNALLKDSVAAIRDTTACSACGIRIADPKGNVAFQECNGFEGEFYEPARVGVTGARHPDGAGQVEDDAGSKRVKGKARSAYVHNNAGAITTPARGAARWAHEAHRRFGYNSLAAIPLPVGGQLSGSIHVADPCKNMLPPHTLKLLQQAAMQLGIAIQRIIAEEEARAGERLREMNEMKGNLLSVVSHELRTPLAAIKGHATLLLEYERRLNLDEKRESLTAIDKASDKMIELVDHLLDMSRLEAGLVRLRKELSSLSYLIRDAVKQVQRRAPARKITVRVNKRLPWLNIDPVRITQVLDNILDNAIKYSQDGSTIAVTAWRQGAEVVVSIADQGKGIPEHELEKIFDRMYRMENRNTPSELGLGLAICNGLVQAHGGRIWMESEEGKGSTCFFALPCSPLKGRRE